MEYNFKEGFRPKDDKELRHEIRRYYYYCLRINEASGETANIELTHKKWFSANALNLVLILIEALRINKPSLGIFVQLLPRGLVETIVVFRINPA